MNRIDLNCDLGESFGAYKIGQDEQMLKYITSANIACGYHAGDHNVISETVQMARENGVAIGAHPGLQDLAGFGRRFIELDEKEVYHLMIYQLGALDAFVKVHNGTLQHVKPHGALYNIAAKDSSVAKAVVAAVNDYDPDLILFALAGSELVRIGRAAGLRVAEEVFADRTYQADGTLTPRTNPQAVIQSVEQAASQVKQIVTKGTVTTVDGQIIPIKADTVCVHGDSDNALIFIKELTSLLAKTAIELVPIGERR